MLQLVVDDFFSADLKFQQILAGSNTGVIKWDPFWWNQTWYKSMGEILRGFPV